jgi:glyceraldehyde 3-phosphate dehydrogenase
MRARLAINGMGRVGRALLHGVRNRPDLPVEIVAVNDLRPADTIAHLLRHDPVPGPRPREVGSAPGRLTVDGHTIRALQVPEPTRLPWDELGIDVVVEATGRFRTRDAAAGHLLAGAAKVVSAAPGAEADLTVVPGLDDGYDAALHDVVADAAGATACAVTLAQVLHHAFGVVEGMLLTVHGYGADPGLFASPETDLHGARPDTANLLPVRTALAADVVHALPELDGRLAAVALRVPMDGASLVALTARLAEPAGAGRVRRAFGTAAQGALKDVLRCTTEPIVSADVAGENASCLVDLALVRAVGETVTVFGWYDDLWAPVQRTLDLVDLVARTLPER